MTGQGNGLYNLATIIKRLEAVASRIEDVADVQEQRAGIINPNAGPSQAAPVQPPPPPPPPPPVVIEDPKAVTVYDETIIEGKLKPFIELTNSFGSDALKEQVSLLEPLFAAVRQVIHTAGSCVQPPQEGGPKEDNEYICAGNCFPRVIRRRVEHTSPLSQVKQADILVTF